VDAIASGASAEGDDEVAGLLRDVRELASGDG